MFNDPSGELAFIAIVAISAAVFAVGNTIAQAINGNINNFWDGLKAFAQGALAGAVIGAGIAASMAVPILGPIVKWAGITYAGAIGISTVAGIGHGLFTGDWSRLENAGRLFLGNFYLDENRSFFGGVLQGVSRFSWEMLQTVGGGGHAHIRNTFGMVDRVEYFGGATFAINENDRRSSRMFRGLSLGNFIAINIGGRLNEENHPEGWMFSEDGLFWHEYGHTFQSERFGLGYLFGVGIPSAFGGGDHRTKPVELQANRWAWRYANKHGYMDFWLYPFFNPLN